MSGAAEKRPAFDEMCKAAIRKEFGIVAAWSVDRLGRALQKLIGFLAKLNSKKVDLYLHQQAVDTTTPAGRALFQMMGVFGEFERAMIQERVKAGLQRAREHGKVIGRPKVSKDVKRAIRRERSSGKGFLKIARELGVGTSVVQRVVASLSSHRQWPISSAVLRKIDQ